LLRSEGENLDKCKEFCNFAGDNREMKPPFRHSATAMYGGKERIRKRDFRNKD